MPSEPDWLEYAKLGVAALTPIMTGVVGIILVRLGTKHGMSLPFNYAIYAALKPYANGALR